MIELELRRHHQNKNKKIEINITFFHLQQTLVKIMYIYSKGIGRLGTEL